MLQPQFKQKFAWIVCKQNTHLFVQILESMIPNSKEKLPKLTHYEGKEDPNEHVQLVDKQLIYFGVEEPFKCKLFALILVGPIWLWFNDLPDGCIGSLMEFHKSFFIQFTARNRCHIIETTLTGIVPRKKECLRSYVDRFTRVSIKVDGAQEGL